MKKMNVLKVLNDGIHIVVHRIIVRLLLFALALSVSSFVLAQDKGITMKMEDVSLGDILQEIKRQSGKNILYNNNKVDKYKHETIDIKNASLDEALKECLKNKKLQYKIVDEVIIIEPAKKDINANQTDLVQTVRGQVVDMNTESPIPGANVILVGSDPVKGTQTDINGNFEIPGVPVGRQNLEVSFTGYNKAIINNLYLYSGKEMVLIIKLEEKVEQVDEVVIKPETRKDRPQNEMATVSARSFTVEETERYAGGIGDPSRMAASFAGVLTMGTQINDIVIRGNTNTGLLWRMEGLRIPNPNHFGSLSSSGGTTSIINNNVLSNSDFYTGAFPAEFGDATSGVFDLRLRKGNNEKREYVVQVGAGGFEGGSEGPFSKKNSSSYLVNYRYSTMGIIKLMGFNIGIFTIPTYQDLSYNINIPLKNNGKLSFFGIGGICGLNGKEIDKAKNKSDVTELNNFMGFTGCNHVMYLNENSSIVSGIGISKTQNKTLIDNRKNNEYDEFIFEQFKESTFEFSTEFRDRINSRNYVKFGVDYYVSSSTYLDSMYLADYKMFYQKDNVKGNIPLYQSFAEWKHRFNDQISLVSGIHYQYSEYGNDHSVEPRFSLSWEFLPKQSVSMGYGRHSKQQPKFVYQYMILKDTLNKIYDRPNRNLKMTRSDQLVLAYNYLFNSNHRLKIETYYQYLTKVPVEKDSSFKTLLNYGTSFSDYDFVDLVNKGRGYNYGAEITLEKFLSKGYYYLFTLSLFESKYRGSDGKLRNTRFNAKYMVNLLGGYEWFVKNRNTYGFDFRVIYAGGERKVPLDYAKSKGKGEAVYIISKAYTEKFADYFRLDTKIFYKINKRTSHTLAIDVVNVTNRQNHFLAVYDKDKNDYEEVSNLSIMPVFLWRWNF
jgi:hypothetical protein